MMFPKNKQANRGQGKGPSKSVTPPQNMSVTCEHCGCNFNVPADQKEPPECPACGETLAPVKRG